MKRLFFLYLFIVFFISTKAQVIIPKMELKSIGFVGINTTKTYVVIDKTYVVIEIPNRQKSELYKSSLVYLNTIYKNPQRVLTLVESESIIIKGMTDAIKGSLSWYKYQMIYNINIQFKDGKIRIEPSITDLTEIGDDNNERKFYVSSEDSPNPHELNCIWLLGPNGYFLFNEKLKTSIDDWLNFYLSSYIDGITKNDW